MLGPSKGEAAETFARDASGSRPAPAQDAPVHARPGEFRPVWSGARPIMASRFLGCSQAPTRHRPFERPLRPEERGGLILKHPPAHSTRPAVHAVERRACRMESLPADALSLVAVSGQGADARRLVVCRIQQPRPRSSLGRSRGPALSVRCARHGVGDEGVGGAARRRRASRQGGRAAVSGSASGCSPHSLTAGGKRSGAGCEPLRLLPQLNL